MGNSAIYASPDGLILISEATVKVLTEKHIDKRKWQQFKPKTIHAYAYEDKYIAFYGDDAGTGSGEGGFIFDLRTGDLTRIDAYATAGYADILTDTLYLVLREGASNNLYAWEGADDTERYTFKTGIAKTSITSFMYCRVWADDPTQVGITIYADGNPILRTSSLQDEYIKLPAYMARSWQIEVTGRSPITRIGLGQTQAELA